MRDYYATFSDTYVIRDVVSRVAAGNDGLAERGQPKPTHNPQPACHATTRHLAIRPLESEDFDGTV